jgi:hypothetical protein
MPALKKVRLPDGYISLADERRAHGEGSRDCTVVAISICCGVSYATAHAALKAAGRKDKRGTYRHQQYVAIRSLGFEVREWSAREKIEMIMSYPKKGIAGLTTHQPRRFAAAWAPHRDKTLLLYSRGHVSAMKDGVVQDWAINRAKQVFDVVEVYRP